MDLGRALCIITGASRGLGRAIARDMSRLVKPGSVLLLLARSADDLQALRAELVESEAGRADIMVNYVAVDLGQAEGPASVVKAAKEAFSKDMDHIILVNNAGKLQPWCSFSVGSVNGYMGYCFHRSTALRSDFKRLSE